MVDEDVPKEDVLLTLDTTFNSMMAQLAGRTVNYTTALEAKDEMLRQFFAYGTRWAVRRYCDILDEEEGRH